MDHQAAIALAQHLGLVASVTDPFQRVGQGLADVFVRLADHIGNRTPSQSGVVELQLELVLQDTIDRSGSDPLGLLLRQAMPFGERPRPLLTRHLRRSFEPRSRCRLQGGEPLAFGVCEVSNHHRAINHRTVMDLADGVCWRTAPPAAPRLARPRTLGARHRIPMHR